MSIVPTEEASPLMRRTWCTILGGEVSDPHWRLSALPIREGGAGLSDPKDIVHAAQVSSWVAAASQTGPLAYNEPPPAWLQVLATLACAAPHLGKPLTVAFQLNNPHHILTTLRQHQLLPQWCSQGTWTDEVNRTLS